ncbi:Retinoic acid receptor responder protein 2 [Manis javanica]|nr:Retinoic acid receptor responder protein 2 [Manis javanica]
MGADPREGRAEADSLAQRQRQGVSDRGRGKGGPRAELTATQHRGLQVALEEFHKHPPVQWAFREISVDSAMETPFPAGTFVRLEFKLQQTSCRKKDWKKAECKVKPNGRKRKCLACIKLDSENKVLGRMVHCPIQTQVQQELEERQEAQPCPAAEAGLIQSASWTAVGGDQCKTALLSQYTGRTVPLSPS